MNARLCSLLVAGGVVLAGIQSGSLHGAALDVVTPTSPIIPTLKGAAFLPAPGEGATLQLAIPGFQGVPRLQVLSHPSRIVVDLPGVDRGPGLTRKVLKGLSNRQVLRLRVAQNSVKPELTRVVLEVIPGTRAEVNSDAAGVSILLNPGKGPIHALLAQANPPVAAPAPVQPVPALPAIAAVPVLTAPAVPVLTAPAVPVLTAPAVPVLTAPAVPVAAVPAEVAPAPVAAPPAPVQPVPALPAIA
ncbi:MAG: AMIN domain-containing protein, partial [Holophaga sp.]|nr:AMIN domain-containing protein [Holophaga sp.]